MLAELVPAAADQPQAELLWTLELGHGLSLNLKHIKHPVKKAKPS